MVNEQGFTELGALLVELATLRERLGIRAACVLSVCRNGHPHVTLCGNGVHYCACAATHEDAIRRLMIALILEEHAARRCPGGVA